MPWSSSARHGTNWKPTGWVKLRRQVFRRAGNQCEYRYPTGVRCGHLAEDCDHVNGDRTDHRIENLQALCRKHHNEKTQAEAAAARRRAPRKRQPEPHPGRIKP